MKTVKDGIAYFRAELKSEFSAQEKRRIAQDFICGRLGVNSSELLIIGEQILNKELVEQIKEAVQLMNQDYPVQYVIGKTYFYNLELKVDERALIPRPETEELVDWIGKDWKGKSPAILDIGTGSGCIPLALKKAIKGSEVTSIDKERAALDLAQENAKLLDLDVKFICADALNLTNTFRQKWDVIVSNPPYIPLEEKELMQKNVIDFEPHSALFVPNNDPLLFYQKIAEYAFSNLHSDGRLYFEVHENYAQDVADLLKDIGYSLVEVRRDLQGKERMVMGRR